MKNTIAFAAGVVAAGFGVRAGASAFCVTTSTELRAALAASSDGGANQDELNWIKVATGTYLTSDVHDRFFYINTSATSRLQIWGDFNSDCSQLGEESSQTILDGGGSTQVLVVRSAHGEVDLLNLTLQNGNTTQPGGGLAVNETGSTSGDVLLRNLIIRNNHTSVFDGGFRAFAYGAHVIYFDNNLVVGNSADQGEGAGELSGDDHVYVRYDTVSMNTAPNSDIGGLFCSGTPVCEIANDAFWQNANTDLYLFSDASMYFNDVGVLGGMSPSTNVGAIDTDPLFVDAAGGNFHLGNGSPLIGVSTYLYSGSDNDIEGHALPLTGSTDVGAYMETIFNDGFEAPSGL